MLQDDNLNKSMLAPDHEETGKISA